MTCYSSCNLPALGMIRYFEFSFDAAVLLARSIKILIYLLCDPVSAVFGFLLKLETCLHCNFDKTVMRALFYICTM